MNPSLIDKMFKNKKKVKKKSSKRSRNLSKKNKKGKTLMIESQIKRKLVQLWDVLLE